MDLKKYVESTGLQKKAFAHMLGISVFALSNYMHRRRTPTLQIADRIIEVTNGKVTIKDLLVMSKKRKENG